MNPRLQVPVEISNALDLYSQNFCVKFDDTQVPTMTISPKTGFTSLSFNWVKYTGNEVALEQVNALMDKVQTQYARNKITQLQLEQLQDAILVRTMIPLTTAHLQCLRKHEELDFQCFHAWSASFFASSQAYTHSVDIPHMKLMEDIVGAISLLWFHWPGRAAMLPVAWTCLSEIVDSFCKLQLARPTNSIFFGWKGGGGGPTQASSLSQQKEMMSSLAAEALGLIHSMDSMMGFSFGMSESVGRLADKYIYLERIYAMEFVHAAPLFDTLTAHGEGEGGVNYFTYADSGFWRIYNVFTRCERSGDKKARREIGRLLLNLQHELHVRFLHEQPDVSKDRTRFVMYLNTVEMLRQKKRDQIDFWGKLEDFLADGQHEFVSAIILFQRGLSEKLTDMAQALAASVFPPRIHLDDDLVTLFFGRNTLLVRELKPALMPISFAFVCIAYAEKIVDAIKAALQYKSSDALKEPIHYLQLAAKSVISQRFLASSHARGDIDRGDRIAHSIDTAFRRLDT